MEVPVMDRERVAEAGSSLVETLVAVLILAIVTVSILAMFTHTMQLNVTGSDYTNLTNLAKDTSEEILGLPYANIVSGTRTVDNPPITISWRVGAHDLIQGKDTPGTAFGADPYTSTAAVGSPGNIKVIGITVNSSSALGFGQRNVTVTCVEVHE